MIYTTGRGNGAENEHISRLLRLSSEKHVAVLGEFNYTIRAQS